MSQNFLQIPKHEVIANVHNAVNKWVERRENEVKIAEKILKMYQQVDVTQSPTENPINLLLLGKFFERKALQAFLYDYDYTDTVEKKRDKQAFLANLLAEEIKFHQQIIVDCNTIVRRWRYFDLKSDAVLNQVQYLILHDSENAYRVYEENVLLTWNIPDGNLPKLEIRESPRDCEIKSFSKIIEELNKEEYESMCALEVEKLRQEELKKQANNSCDSETTDNATPSQVQSTNLENNQTPAEVPPTVSHKEVPTSAEKMASNQNDSAGNATVTTPKTKSQKKNEKKAAKARRLHQFAPSFVRNEKNATLSVRVSPELISNKHEESATLPANAPITMNENPVSKDNEPLSNLPEASQDACNQSSISAKIEENDLAVQKNAGNKEQKVVEERRSEQLAITPVVSEIHTSNHGQRNAWPGANQTKAVASASSSVSANTVPPPLTKTQKNNAKKAAKLLKGAALISQQGAEESVVEISPEQEAAPGKTPELLATIPAGIETQKDVKDEAVPLEQRVMEEKKDSELLTATPGEKEIDPAGLDVVVQPSIAKNVEETNLNDHSDAKDKAVVDSLEQTTNEERKELDTTSVVSQSQISDNSQKIAWPGAIQLPPKVITTVSSSVSTETRPLTKTDKKKAKAAARLLKEAALNAQKGAEESVVATLREETASGEKTNELLSVTPAANETKQVEKDEMMADPLERREVEEEKEPKSLTAAPADDKPASNSSEQKVVLREDAQAKPEPTSSPPTETVSKTNQPALEITAQPPIAKEKTTPPTSTETRPMTKTDKKKAKAAARLLREAALNAQKSAKESVVAMLPQESASVEKTIELFSVSSTENETKNDEKDKVVVVPLEQREVEEKKEPEFVPPTLVDIKQSSDSDEQKVVLQKAVQAEPEPTSSSTTQALSETDQAALEIPSQPAINEQQMVLQEAVQANLEPTSAPPVKALSKTNQAALGITAQPSIVKEKSTLPTPIEKRPLTKTDKKKAKAAARLLREAALNAQEGAKESVVPIFTEESASAIEILSVTPAANGTRHVEKDETMADPLEQREVEEEKEPELLTTAPEDDNPASNSSEQKVVLQEDFQAKLEPTSSPPVEALSETDQFALKIPAQSAIDEQKVIRQEAVQAKPKLTSSPPAKAVSETNQAALEIPAQPAIAREQTTPPTLIETRPMTKTDKKKAKTAARLLREAALNAQKGAEESVVEKEEVVVDPLGPKEVEEKNDTDLLTTTPADIKPSSDSSEQKVVLQEAIQPFGEALSETNEVALGITAEPAIAQERTMPLTSMETQNEESIPKVDDKTAKLLNEAELSSEIVEYNIVIETNLETEDEEDVEGCDTDTSSEAANDDEPLKKNAQPTQRRVISGRKKAKKSKKSAKKKQQKTSQAALTSQEPEPSSQESESSSQEATSSSQEATSSSQEATSSDQVVPKISKYQKKRAKIAAQKQQLLDAEKQEQTEDTKNEKQQFLDAEKPEHTEDAKQEESPAQSSPNVKIIVTDQQKSEMIQRQLEYYWKCRKALDRKIGSFVNRSPHLTEYASKIAEKFINLRREELNKKNNQDDYVTRSYGTFFPDPSNLEMSVTNEMCYLNSIKRTDAFEHSEFIILCTQDLLLDEYNVNIALRLQEENAATTLGRSDPVFRRFYGTKPFQNKNLDIPGIDKMQSMATKFR